MSDQPDLHKILSLSYANKDKQKKDMAKYGYNYDSMLSNGNNQVYFNPETQKLIHSVSGTHSLNDIGTDVALAFGRLKDTSRYNDSHHILRSAKQKYGVDKATVTGSSLGGTIAGYIASKGDEVYSLNKGAIPGAKIRDNEHAYRTSGDVISLANANNKHMETLDNPNGGLFNNIKNSALIGVASPFLGVAHGIRSALNAHSTESIKDKRIRI